MTATLLFGCVLLAYGPAAALLLLYVARRSALLVVALLAAFALLAALLALALIFLAAPAPVRQAHAAAAVVGALLQEAARLLFSLAYARAEAVVEAQQSRQQIARREREREREQERGRGRELEGYGASYSAAARGAQPRLSNDLAAAVAAGCGWGLMHTVMVFGGAIAASAGEEAWFRPSCPTLNAFVLTAATALLYSALHVALCVLALDAFRRRSAARACAAPALHVAFALTALLAETAPFEGACSALLPLLLLELGVAIAWALFGVVRRADYAAAVQIAVWTQNAADANAASARSGAAREREREGAAAGSGRLESSVATASATAAAGTVTQRHPALAAR